MLLEVAEQHSARYIIANDPDADRLSLAERLEDGEWRVYNGNEIAALLVSFLLRSEQFAKVRSQVEGAGRVAMLTTCVSSKLLKAVCEKEGLKYGETLTGFKYLGNLACEMKKAGDEVVFMFEEAIGMTAVLIKVRAFNKR